MKLNPASHPAGLPRRTGRKKEKGVALVTVLAIVLLMTVLITSFFTMSAAELAASQKESDNLKARAFADAAVNMAIAQIREGTTQVDTDGTALAWSSQPGAIRVYQKNGQLKAIYKLYSAQRVNGRGGGQALQSLKQDDIERSWDSMPDQWVDLNEPIVVPNLSSPDDIDRAELYFPIVDPRAKRTAAGETVEGFDYKSDVNGVVVSGNGKQRLPMPVRWLYILADGSIGYMGDSQFASTGNASEPTKENPIVGRVAFWTDDETCKINVNTASEGVYWDTPRTSTKEDFAMGMNQPVNGEYQRYPGHPAMVCMSSVLFPHRRLRGAEVKAETKLSSSGGQKPVPKKDLSLDDAQSIWRMTPYISADPSLTSNGGTKRANSLMSTAGAGNTIPPVVQTPNPKHLYSSNDDYVFSSLADANKKPGDMKPSERATVADKDDTKIPVDRIQQSRFFLTTRSSAPEITLQGQPKVALWAVDQTLAANSRGFEGVTVNSGSRYTIFDTLIAFNSTFKKGNTLYPYYFGRTDAYSRHAEFYSYAKGRNNVLFKYLSTQIAKDIPGFRLTKGQFPSFGAKFGDGQYEDIRFMVGMMLDYMRQVNLYDPNLQPSARYNSVNGSQNNAAFGQVTPICLCGGSSDHRTVWSRSTVMTPKGIGRFLTVSEVAMMITLRAKRQGNTMSPPGITFLTTPPPPQGQDAKEYQVGFLVEAFAPAQGWGEYRPYAQVSVMGGIDEQTSLAVGNFSDINASMTLNGQRILVQGTGANAFASTDQSRLPTEWTASGGSMGARVFTTVCLMAPNLFISGGGRGGGAGDNTIAFGGTSVTGGTGANAAHPRLVVYDSPGATGSYAGLNEDQLIQVIPLPFPSFTMVGPSEPAPLALQGGTKTRMQSARETGVVFGNNGLITESDIVQSLVPNHGDYRLISARRNVLQSRAPSGGGRNPRDWPTFVPVPGYGIDRQAHSLAEPIPAMNEVAVKRRPERAQATAGYFDPNEHNLKIQEAYYPDFPIRPWDNRDIPIITGFSGGFNQGGLIGGNEKKVQASEAFQATRYDKQTGGIWEKGPGRPDITGDFDTGVGPLGDGPYINKGDDGDVRAYFKNGTPYFSALKANTNVSTLPPVNAASFAPNRMVQSAVQFGSMPSSVAENVPWTTLLFRPDPWVYDTSGKGKSHRHFGSKGIHDHLWLDFFWMPVVQPYAISEPFETKGKINMNHQILPFTYITRATALHALLKPERVTLIPNTAAPKYKLAASNDDYKPNDDEYRHFIDPYQTLRQWDDRFANKDQYAVENQIQPGAFISPTEICDQFLVPEGLSLEDARDEMWTEDNLLTGENLKERPYGNLYPRLTTRSNAYRVHVVAQSIKKARLSDPTTIDRKKGDQITAEYRGSYLVERTIDPSDSEIPDYAAEISASARAELPSLDRYYYFRISQVKQFVR